MIRAAKHVQEVVTAVTNTNIAEPHFAHLRARHESGDRRAAITAVQFSGYLRVPVPDWALQAVATGFATWNAGKARTLDEALGVERPKGWRKTPQEYALAPLVWITGSEMLRAGRARDDEFKEDLAARCSVGGMSVGKTTAYEMFLEYERLAHGGQQVKPAKKGKRGFSNKHR